MQIKHLSFLKCLRDSLILSILQNSSAQKLNGHSMWGNVYMVCSLLLGPNIALRPTADKTLYLRLKIEKMNAFAVLTAVVAPILRLRSTVQFQKLKYKVK